MMDMSGMDMSSGSTNTTSSSMTMVFFTSYMTPLYSMSWSPSTPGSYAGTCVFIIFLAVVLRFLLAFKVYKESAWLDAEFNRRYVSVVGKQPVAERISQDSDTKRMVLSENGVEEEVMVVKRRTMVTRPWRFTVDPVRAVLDTVSAGIAYLLMLAVMTMNVGYFLSVLGGVFLGSLMIGRYTSALDH